MFFEVFFVCGCVFRKADIRKPVGKFFDNGDGKVCGNALGFFACVGKEMFHAVWFLCKDIEGEFEDVAESEEVAEFECELWLFECDAQVFHVDTKGGDLFKCFFGLDTDAVEDVLVFFSYFDKEGNVR